MKKKYILILSSFLLGNLVNAQQTETVSIGAGYTNQLYYELSSSTETVTPKNDWDIAFETYGSGWSIRLNDPTGVKLWSASNDTTDFASIDTTGNISSWVELRDSDTSWAYGAFAQNQAGFDLGWGSYNMITHQVVGDEIFVIKLSNGSYQKIWIKSLITGVYTFRHASLDNSMDMTHTLSKSSYNTKNFVYYSLVNHAVIDKEPHREEWDLFFGQYAAEDQGFYNVSGVLSNAGVEVIDVSGVDADTYNDFGAHQFSHYINEIGYDWKVYDFAQGWILDDDRVYFVKDLKGDVYKIVFTGFGGSGSGDFEFTKEKISSVSIDETSQGVNLLTVYPNPASNNINIAYESVNNAKYEVYNASGQLLKSDVLNAGFGTEQIDLGYFTSGIYFLKVNNQVVKFNIIK